MSSTVGRVEDEDLIDVRLIAAKIAHRRWWVCGSVLAWTAVFAALAFLMTPVYRASTILAPAAENHLEGGLGSALGQLGGLASLAGLNVQSSGPETEEALAVLRSREFTENFIRDKNLLPKLFASKWDPQRQTWRSLYGEPKAPTLAKAFKYFDRRVRNIVPDKKTGLVTLQIDWRDREEAAAWANELVERLNKEMRQRAIAKADASVGYLEKEANTTSTITTREAIGRLMESQIKQRMLANVTQEYALKVVDRALPADKDDPVRPQKLVLIVTGFLIGAATGIGCALLFTPRLPDSQST